MPPSLAAGCVVCCRFSPWSHCPLIPPPCPLSLSPHVCCSAALLLCYSCSPPSYLPLVALISPLLTHSHCHPVATPSHTAHCSRLDLYRGSPLSTGPRSHISSSISHRQAHFPSPPFVFFHSLLHSLYALSTVSSFIRCVIFTKLAHRPVRFLAAQYPSPRYPRYVSNASNCSLHSATVSSMNRTTLQPGGWWRSQPDPQT